MSQSHRTDLVSWKRGEEILWQLLKEESQSHRTDLVSWKLACCSLLVALVLSRNPTVLIWSVGSCSAAGRLPRTQRAQGRNPTVLIWSVGRAAIASPSNHAT